MNFHALIAIAAAAIAGVSADSTADCTSTQTTAAYTTLAGLLSNPDMDSCATASGYNMLYATALPSDSQYTLMCASTVCQDFLAAVSALNPPDCVLTIPTSGLAMNIYSMANGFDAECASLSSSTSSTTSSTTSSASSSTTTTPATTTATPATTTATPATTTATPATTTAAPATSSASSAATSC